MQADRGPWIQVRSGGRFYPFAPRAAEIDIYDIAWSLARKCRYNGHCSATYTVAEHSVRCAWLLAKTDAVLALCGLLHDAHEAYTGDLPQPLKHGPGMESFRYMEAACERAVAQAFALPWPMSPLVKWADRALLHTEARDLMQPLDADWAQWLDVPALPQRIEPMSEQEAFERFLSEFEALTGQAAAVRAAIEIAAKGDD